VPSPLLRRPEERRPTTSAALEPPWRSLREANLLLRERWQREVAGLGLSYTDAAVLQLCARAPTRVSEVGRAIGVTAAGATDVVDRLESRNLVRRSPDTNDRRAVRIRLTPTGERLLARSHAAKEATVRLLNGAMTLEERRALAEGLEALVRALRAAPGSV
jgi:DNA-binding MarR family transcriptional regulator